MKILARVRKRDGRIVKFDKERITSAIAKAGKASGEFDRKEAARISKLVVDLLQKIYRQEDVPGVEDIQDMVENVLMQVKHYETAKAYILYREQRAQIRDIEHMIDSDKMIHDYLQQKDWRVKENANMNYSLQGLNNYVAATVSAHYWLNRSYPKNIRKAHIGGDFHIHDLQSLAAYCSGWEIKDLLLLGFRGAPGKIESAPPKHFRSALGQIVNFFYTIQGEVAGAIAFSNFDTYLAPFIHYDNLSYKEVKQSLQEFLFNMNVPTRVGFQTPFTNITLDLKVPEIIAKEPVIIGGKLQKEKYGEFQKEMDMFNSAFNECMVNGDALGRVFTFPIPTYNISKKFDWNDPKYNPIFETAAKYGIPYFANFINSDMNPEDARSMCCRLRLDNRELRKRGGGLFAANPLTGSVGVVTLNMARIGYLAKDKKDLLKRIDDLMDLAKDSLEIKRELLEKLTENGLYPYCKFYLGAIKAGYGQYWKNHFATIGINGLNEAIVNFMEKNIASHEGQKLAVQILKHMREKLSKYQLETGNLYNLEATPAEGTSYRLAKADKKNLPDIIVANEEAYKNHGAAPYYTNSSQLPVNYTTDIFEALDLQDELQTLYTGGTVLHGFIGERLENAEACKRLVKKIAENYHLPYFTITPTFSICPKHGYIAGEHQYCPKCDIEIGYYVKTQISKVKTVAQNFTTPSNHS
ncbi:MAG: ribonucleoside triphosphate reductase [Patescibacteria group bacterium]|nr:ribonucleoside triphosphate reductase [Patescibacteria group bacterium]